MRIHERMHNFLYPVNAAVVYVYKNYYIRLRLTTLDLV